MEFEGNRYKFANYLRTSGGVLGLGKLSLVLVVIYETLMSRAT